MGKKTLTNQTLIIEKHKHHKWDKKEKGIIANDKNNTNRNDYRDTYSTNNQQPIQYQYT